MAYLSGTVIVKFADASGITLYKELGCVSNTALIAWVTENLISALEGRIHNITQQTFTVDTVDPAVVMAGNQAGANVLIYMRANRSGPFVTNPQGFNLQVPVFKAFTPEIMEILLGFKKDREEQLASSEYKTDKIRDTWEEN